MDAALWWVPPLSVGTGVVLGFGLSELREFFRRMRERRGHLEALAAELQICAEMADGYVAGNVMAPAYRMPLIAYSRSLPALLADGVLQFAEIAALIRFYVNAQAFNFSIDKAQEVLMTKEEDRPPKRLEAEVRRARLKANKLGKQPEAPGHYHAAIAVIRAHLPKKSHGRLSLEDEDLTEPAETP